MDSVATLKLPGGESVFSCTTKSGSGSRSRNQPRGFANWNRPSGSTNVASLVFAVARAATAALGIGVRVAVAAGAGVTAIVGVAVGADVAVGAGVGVPVGGIAVGGAIVGAIAVGVDVAAPPQAASDSTNETASNMCRHRSGIRTPLDAQGIEILGFTRTL
jgi:hypothetical protein